MKYKVGDFVRIREWDDMVEEYGIDDDMDIVKQDAGYVFFKDMKEFCGKIIQISKVCSNSYHIKDDDKGFYFCDWMIEKKVEKMTKDDLKDGMVVEDKEGFRGVITNGKIWSDFGLFLFRDDLGEYASDLRKKDSPSCDIVKIYQPHDITIPTDFLDKNHLTLIWERKEPKKMTVEEISEALGYEVEVVEG